MANFSTSSMRRVVSITKCVFPSGMANYITDRCCSAGETLPFTASARHYLPGKIKYTFLMILDIDMNLFNIALKVKHTDAGNVGVTRRKISVSKFPWLRSKYISLTIYSRRL